MEFKEMSELLRRSDKLYLGFGEKLVWTPTHPTCPECLGFWDASNFYDVRVYPNYTIHVFLGDDPVPLNLKVKGRTWIPNALETEYEEGHLRIRELKTVLKDSLVSELVLENVSEEELRVNVVAWGRLENGERSVVNSIRFQNDVLSIVEDLKKGERNLRLFRAFGISDLESFQVQFSKDGLSVPRFEYTPFFDYFDGRLEDEIRYFDEEGGIYHALHAGLTLRPLERRSLRVVMAFGLDPDETLKKLRECMDVPDLRSENERRWNEFLRGIPDFRSSNERMERYYWYRWYGLKLFSLDTPDGRYRYPIVFEGPDYFRIHITYSAQCHMREMKWGKIEFAEGSLLNFLENQREDGSLPGHVYFDGTFRESFYHADWGKAALEVFLHTGDLDFVRRITPGLLRYARYMDEVRDREHSGMYDVLDHFETGQEFSRRYTVVNDKADTYEWRRNLRLKGVDATVYTYNLKRALSIFLERLGDVEGSLEMARGAERISKAVRSKMWDPEVGMFFDVDPTDMRRTGVKTAVSFYPYMTDIPDRSHLDGLKAHVLNPEEFWTPYPVPTLSVDDPMFNPHAEWKGKRLPCPWNGRVWPMTNSHLVEALGTTSRRFEDSLLRSKTVELLERFIDMMFFKGEPTSFEHYNPYNKRPSLYRGVDDYQHSWVVDLILKYVVGLHLKDDGTLVFDPFPFEGDFDVKGVRIRDLNIGVSKRGERYTVTSNGSTIFSGPFEGEIVISKFV